MPPQPSPSAFANFQVLVVDDEKTIQRLVYDVLTRLGFTNIMPVGTGKAALELIEVCHYDLIITDWRITDMEGIDIVKYVRQTTDMQTTPIIMLTANTEAYYVLKARDAGISGYLIKPFSADQLAKRIRAVIENPGEFVICTSYKGPERRHKALAPKVERRKRRKRR